MSAAAFEQATQDILKLTKPVEDTVQLQIYALYKIARNEDISKSKPGMFDIKAKYKKNAWQASLDRGVTPEQAQKEYTETIEKLKVTHGYDPNKVPEKVRA
ncbi:diazepam-binding protein inhibitor (GABA receptor modulator, acyl-CoA-binding protein) [Sporothrix schenckii 1099-18]|uniref:ACB domain-containing protein n=2 Tax=Sporothrix schenckii TaxID=29908 RepID=U7PPX6_SPOS1|nr:diazepam-binding protein inhibitor (GABA receptor modulator, acyl-CoA-binding protein) [Sporothrix schenckii 1099-18]ERS96799.1 hypothetical protein HMPREF1624_07008 [Sporothrix schenckii ATCC 58251]KJR81528.1 diazepam-binding protein inhibitor (GABA receptor modulator, acyl-CoA-binding protein) [Sporothrix schenckii 1099-18]